MVICVIVCAVLAFVVFEHAMILSTAMLGSYFTIRGIAVYGGGYYNAFTVIDMMKAGLIDQIDPIYWGYLTGIIVLTIIGALVQYKCRPKKKEDEQRSTAVN